FGTASGEQRERFIVLSRLLKLAGHARYWMMQPQEVVLLLAQILYPSNRLGEGPELVYCHTATALMMSAAGQGRISKRAGRRAIEIARRLEDPALESYARMNRAIALNVLGDVLDSEREMREVLSANAGWLDHGEYTQGIADISWNLQLRGYAKEAKRWVDRGLTSERQAEHQQGQIFMPSRAAICLVTRGMVDAARRYLRQASRIAEAAPGDTYRQGNYLSHLAFFHLEQGHLDDASVAVDSYRQLALIPKRTPFHMRNMYVFQAYLRLFEAERAGHVTDQLRLARSELASVCSSGHPVLNAHLQVISGGESRLADEEDAALDALESALRLAHRADAPWPAFEAQVQRAALLRHQGHINSADRLARSAYDEALERGWVLRARRVRRRFSQLAHGSHSMVRNEREIETDEAQLSARSVQLQRHVDALVQVSQVSLSVVDTDSQARAILDEVVSLFGAERAFLFLRTEDPDADELRLFAARNSIRSDLRDASGYSTQVLERVLGLREPVVVSGNEDAIAIGSESAIALNLRSIIAAPLMIRDRLVGTVYLDNRLAKGVFTRDDAETLTAISSHIAIALETSRTAKLELEYKSEREKRALAEALRSLTDHTSPMTHDTQIVMRLLESMQDFVPARRIDCY
ncbi:MAG: GAF domain-containing protein, partial [Myxococcota bacterium]